MLFGALLPGKRRRTREQCVRGLVAAVNRNDYSDLATYLTSDVGVSDLGGAEIEGRDAFIEGDRRFRDGTGNPVLTIDTLDHNGEEVLVRGHLDGGSPDVSGPTMWRLFFRDDRICSIEVTRADGQRSMPAFAANAAENAD